MTVYLTTLCLALGILLAGCGGSAGKPQVRGVILFVGDGMGVATVTAARVHRGAREGASPPASGRLRLDAAHRSCLVRTWSRDHLVTDSAASITALVAGERVPNGVLSARPGPEGSVEPLTTLLEIAESRGLSTGVVTTTRITHATPAGLFAHVLDRGEESRIAEALIPGPDAPDLGDGIEVILGGGRLFFRPADTGGRREDGRDLAAEMEEAGYRFVETGHDLERALEARADRVLGLFSDSHMAYAADRGSRSPQEPTLAEMTRAAVEILDRNPAGFFLLVEGGRIDHALHNTNGYRAITDMLAFDDAVGTAVDRMGEAALIAVTADHDHTLVIAGYPPVDADVFAQAGVDARGKPYTTLLFANGPSAREEPPEVLESEMPASPDFRERAGVPLTSETHGGMDVPLYLFGSPQTLPDLPGTIDNTEVFGILRNALPAGNTR